jgi:hypothetical protein
MLEVEKEFVFLLDELLNRKDGISWLLDKFIVELNSWNLSWN